MKKNNSYTFKKNTSTKLKKKVNKKHNKTKKGGDYTLSKNIQNLEDYNNVSTASKPLYFGNGINPFQYTIDIAKNLDTGLYKNNPLEWKLWTMKNIGGKRKTNYSRKKSNKKNKKK